MKLRGSDFPGVFEGGRKAAFLALAALTITETGAQLGAATALRHAISAHHLPATSTLPWLACASGALALSFWGRSVLAEWIGQNYVNDIRAGLAKQSVKSALGRGRLGTIAVRMSADLNALKNWADIGICGGVSGLLTLAAGIVSAGQSAGYAGLIAASAGPSVTALLAALLARPLYRAIRRRRSARGLLSAKTGDGALSARVAAAFSAYQKFVRPIRRSGQKLAAASVHEQVIVKLLEASAIFTAPLGIAILIIAAGETQPAAAGWAGMLFALGFCAAGSAALVRSFEAILEQVIARRKLHDLGSQAQAAPSLAPAGENRLAADAREGLFVDGAELLAVGEQRTVPRASASDLLDRVMRGADGVKFGALDAASVSSRDWSRRIACVTPSIPLPRGYLAEVLAARRRPKASQIDACLAIAGLDRQRDGLAGMIDPWKSAISAPVRARLQLARALVHQPSVLILDDAWLFNDAPLQDRLSRWCREHDVSLLIVSPV